MRTSGLSRCRNGTCTSHECSSSCPASSKSAGRNDSLMRRASSAFTGASPSGVRHAPSGQTAKSRPAPWWLKHRITTSCGISTRPYAAPATLPE
jgi:hypothetical protein